MSTPEERVLPSWYDEKLHSAGDGGIFETATNTMLDETGSPRSLAVRLARAAVAAAETPPAEVAAASAETKAGKRRGTVEILENAAAAAAEPKE